MKVNSISPISCQAKPNAKMLKGASKMTVPLKDGNIAELTVADNFISTVISKGDKIIKETSLPLEEGITSRYLWGSYERLQKQAKSGFDFFGEFCKAILK